jgi:hypothetical protein
MTIQVQTHDSFVAAVSERILMTDWPPFNPPVLSLAEQ